MSTSLLVLWWVSHVLKLNTFINRVLKSINESEYKPREPTREVRKLALEDAEKKQKNTEEPLRIVTTWKKHR